MKPDGGPAFPQVMVQHPNGTMVCGWDGYGLGGASLRDWFAAHAPAMPEQWFEDSPRRKSDPLWHWSEASAAWAYCYADAMLAERAKP